MKIASEEGVPRLWKVRKKADKRNRKHALSLSFIPMVVPRSHTRSLPQQRYIPDTRTQGFGAYFLRGGGHTVFMFLFYEQYKALARKLCS
jgi:hypothetical protein